MVNWHSFNGIKSRPDELILLYAFVPSQSAILTLLCISEWQEHVQIFTLVIQGYKWQDTGEVLEVMSAWYSWVSRTVSPSWCLACPLSPWRQWLVVTGRPPLSPPLHCTVGQEAVFYNVCVSCGDRCGVEKRFHPSENEQQNKQNIVRYWKTEEPKTYSHQLIFPWGDW